MLEEKTVFSYLTYQTISVQPKIASCDGNKEATAITAVCSVAADISSCEKYIVLCTSDTQLSLWETDNLSVIRNLMNLI